MIKMQILHVPGCSCCNQAIGYAENLEREFSLEVETIDMTKNPGLVDKYNIRTSPGIVINGKLVSVGETTEEEMRKHLQEAQDKLLSSLMNKTMQIQLLYFDGCPAWQGGLKNLKQALKELNLSGDLIEMVNIKTDEEVQEHQFIGSPTMRVDGEDIDPAASGQTVSRKGCRIYKTPEGIKHEPTVQMIKEFIEKKLWKTK